MPYIHALAICALAAAFEGLCAGRDPMGRLRALRQPWWSPPAWVWVLIGIFWYGICFTALVRLLPLWPDQRLPVLLLVALMVLNGVANIPTFRLRRLDLALAFFAIYWPVLGAFLWAVCPLDGLTFRLFAAYGAYQLYAAAWGYRLWRMNRDG
ncbi:MAG TPA: tryptophan-rich sensory protein [Allosphingosinicella sp.]|nr:tryptophan-rich sensory protein [Allosphingosinicella sp.]